MEDWHSLNITMVTNEQENKKWNGVEESRNMQEEETDDAVSPLKKVYPMWYGRPPFIGFNKGKLDEKIKPNGPFEISEKTPANARFKTMDLRLDNLEELLRLLLQQHSKPNQRENGANNHISSWESNLEVEVLPFDDTDAEL
ncbi:uncharacterized protein G2W53_014135 [Senna tora]|uniref:Uncharacterized protein n=1 Tax=Senna tora TaxID=362788 RepID=A0A834WSY6_9FABA|nr:uncharacterized protein G2W53_014135 [Senna tora]